MQSPMSPMEGIVYLAIISPERSVLLARAAVEASMMNVMTSGWRTSTRRERNFWYLIRNPRAKRLSVLKAKAKRDMKLSATKAS